MNSFQKILVANRGEIAVRVIRTAHEMGYSTVAVYSDADQDSLHVASADQAVCIGAPAASESYLSIEKIIDAAKASGADAVHPGYGFLSENAEFAERCSQESLVFIGPKADAIRLMGSKRLSKVAMLESEVPCIPGYQGSDQSSKVLLAQAKEIGLPLMIKASAGGGGRGMRLVHRVEDIPQQLNAARAEAKSAFGNDELILERALIEPRHIEIQIFADMHGNVVYLGERDCSIQRRHQKVVEEAPSPFVDQALRECMGEAAVNAVRACDYVGAGTVEFLVDANKDFYFLEMNTRLQVEHPVTEMITGQDLVRWQLLVANGHALPLTQDQMSYSGHAIEVRLYAEDPRENFLPQTGQVVEWRKPNIDGIRVDTGIKKGQIVSPYYDPMLAKVISFKPTRDEAVAALVNGLDKTVLLGLNHNIAFLKSVLGRQRFKNGGATTAFLEQEFKDEDYQVKEPSNRAVALAAVLFFRQTQLNPIYPPEIWSSAVPLISTVSLSCGEINYSVELSNANGLYRVSTGGVEFSFKAERQQNEENRFAYSESGVKSSFDCGFTPAGLFMQLQGEHFEFQDISYRPASNAASAGDGSVRAAMDGAIVEVAVASGDKVEAGQIVAVLEAMKMAHQLKAGVSGVVREVNCVQGQQVKTRQVLIIISEDDE